MFKPLALVASAQKYTKSHKDILKVIGAGGVECMWGACIFALMPLIAAFYFGSVEKAGLVIAFFTALQVFVFNAIAGEVTDKRGSLLVFRIGIIIETIGACAFFATQSFWAVICFFLGFFMRWSFFVLDNYLLRAVKSSEGGVVFGIKEEVFAIANFLGLLIFAAFLEPERWVMLGGITLIFNIVALWFLSDVTPVLKKKEPLKLAKALNIFGIIKVGLNFIKINHKYPLFVIGSRVFEGIFYGSIWFLFPIHLGSMVLEGDASLPLGIYEIITFVLALFCGILADRLDWRKFRINGLGFDALFGLGVGILALFLCLGVVGVLYRIGQ